MHRPSRVFRHAFLVLAGLSSLGATCVPNPNEHPVGDMGPPAPTEIGFADIEKDLKDTGATGCGTALPVCHSETSTLSKLKIGADHAANYQLVKGMFVDLMDPPRSPLLQKATNMSAHTGGAILTTSSPVYQRWLKWITDGAVDDPKNKPTTYADIEKDLKDAGPKGCGTALAVCHSAGATLSKLKIGADRAANYQLVKGMFVDLMDPPKSPLLQKATNMATHTGGAILTTSDPVYLRWLGWIQAGAPEK